METTEKPQLDKEAWEQRIKSFSKLLSEESISRLLAAEDWLIEYILQCETGKGVNRGPMALARLLLNKDPDVSNMQSCVTKYGFAFEYLNIASSVARDGIEATLANKRANGRSAYKH